MASNVFGVLELYRGGDEDDDDEDDECLSASGKCVCRRWYRFY